MSTNDSNDIKIGDGAANTAITATDVSDTLTIRDASGNVLGTTCSGLTTTGSGLGTTTIGTTTIGTTTTNGGFLPLQVGGLTTEEQKELGELTKEREKLKKHAKLQKIKSYPPELREKLTNILQLKEAIEDINSTEAEKSAREIELDNKSNTLNYTISDGTSWLGDIQLPNLQDLTYKDVANAHAEQILEEEISEE